MRATFVLATSLLISALGALPACKHPEICCGPAIQPGLIGNWSLVYVDNGLAGGYNVPADSTVILTLTRDSTYHLQDNMVVAESGTFHLADTPIATLANIPQPVIVFSAGLTPFGNGPTVYALSHDSLTLGTSVYDGPSTIYVKID
ncbi:MAG TPA: hypothetical protein VG101_11400 [Puia sp.]|jgi:hypothetical protein|nr:hypothetical protein [Puia sp.]